MFLTYLTHIRRELLGFALVFLLLLGLEAGYLLLRDDLAAGAFGVQIAAAEEVSALSAEELHFADTAYRRFTVDLAARGDWLQARNVYLVAGYSIYLPADTEFSFLPSSEQITINRQAIRRFIVDELAELVERPAQDVSISQRDGHIVFDGIAAAGREIDTAALLQRVSDALADGETIVEIPYRDLSPQITVSDDLQRMGIYDMLASVEMDYSGSHEGRTHNIHAAAEKISGQIIQPGEEYSFNDALFPLSVTDFVDQPVIVRGEFVPELGGGVCQVSSTVFRAALAAGLPLTEHSPHSVRISFYRPPGLDAAVYPGQKDLRFVNDTGHAILLQAQGEGETVRVTLYGSSDGRTAHMIGPLYPDGSSVTDISRYDLRYLWQRELTSSTGETITEDYAARYNR